MTCHGLYGACRDPARVNFRNFCIRSLSRFVYCATSSGDAARVSPPWWNQWLNFEWGNNEYIFVDMSCIALATSRCVFARLSFFWKDRFFEIVIACFNRTACFRLMPRVHRWNSYWLVCCTICRETTCNRWLCHVSMTFVYLTFLRTAVYSQQIYCYQTSSKENTC